MMDRQAFITIVGGSVLALPPIASKLADRNQAQLPRNTTPQRRLLLASNFL